MDKRYRLMSELEQEILNNIIKLYRNKTILNKTTSTRIMILPVIMPNFYIVVVIDEFADMILTVGKKVEDLIIRLAQKSRAAELFDPCYTETIC